MTSSITVIIATYNRAEMLDDCLLWLRAQAWQPGDQVIVADNGSTDRTADVVARHHGAAPRVQYVLETTPGKSSALQTALSHATGDTIAFTDDDVRVGAGWIAAIRTAMQDRSVVLVGGPVHPRWEGPSPSWLRVGEGPYTRLAAPIALLDYGRERTDLGERTLLGANMAVRREVIEALGGFAAHLGKLRDTLLSGEDADLCDRIRRHGGRSLYLPEAAVQHWVPQARMRLGYYLHWFYWSGITHATLDAADGDHSRGRRIAGLPAWLGRRFAQATAGLVLATARLRADLAVDRLNDIAFVLGYASRHRTAAATLPMNPPARRLTA